MNNFYDDAFNMVPYERPNLAVQQLSVNEDGDVGLDGSLSVAKWYCVSQQMGNYCQ